MSISTTAFGRSAHSRRSSRTATYPNLFGSTAIAALVIGCAWALYANVLGADVYPSLHSADYDLPVVRRTSSVAVKKVPQLVNNFLADAEPAASTSATDAPQTPLMFNERFAAAAPSSDAPKFAAASPPATTSANAPPKVAEVAKAASALKLAETRNAEAPKAANTRIADAKAVDAKSADAPKAKEVSPASTQVALNSPASVAVTKPADAPAAKPSAAASLVQRAKSAVMAIASGEKQSIVEKLWGKQEGRASLLSFASADASVTGSLGDSRPQNPMLGGSPPYDRQTAVYDITAHTVYLPDGTKLEAHSGLGSELDDPSSAKIRMRGVTPPHIYELKPREALFHGVAALRLNPIGGEDAIFGRAGLLAHTFMLGPNGDSNGCVSFRDYNAFLNAYRNQGIKKLAVVARVQ